MSDLSGEGAVSGGAVPGLVLHSFEPMKVARACLAVGYPTPGGGAGLVWYRGCFWAWKAGRWAKRQTEEVKEDLYGVLEDAGRSAMRADGGSGWVRYAPKADKIADVCEALKALVRCKWAQLPQWTAAKVGDPDPEWCVGFGNGVVSVEGGVVQLMEGGERWLDTGGVRVDWDPEAKCERWLQVVGDWSRGDPVWERLLQTWMGYCLLPTRRFEKWMCMLAPVRAGKGTITTVLASLMGDDVVLSKDFKAMKGEYGLAGIENARVLVINEVKQAEMWEGEEVARITKSLVGQDLMTINTGKWKPVLENVRCRAAVMMSSNDIPNLPNRAGGLSSKMLVLHFTKSFKGAEDESLKDTLVQKELPGIAVWAIEGARRLAELGREAWVLTDEAAEKVRVYETLANVFQEFLEGCFVRDEDGWVMQEMVIDLWKGWVAKHHLGKVNVQTRHLLMRLEAETSWGVLRVRSKRAETRDQWGLRGCAVKRVG